jgi:hypothetical protein
VKNDFHVSGRSLAKFWVKEISFENFAVNFFEILFFAARKIFHNTRFCSKLDQSFTYMGTDKGSSTGD